MLTISEPGGDLDGKHMQIVGAPRYEVGEEVVVFASPTPIGYLRTCGWGQGKFEVRPGDGGAAKQVTGMVDGRESGTAAGAYLLAYALFADPMKLHPRALVFIAPHAILGLVWAAVFGEATGGVRPRSDAVGSAGVDGRSN